MAKFIGVLEKLYHVKSLFTVIDIHSSFRSWPFQAVGDTMLRTLKDALNQYVTNGLFPRTIDAYRTYTRITVGYPKYLTINIVQRMDLQGNNCVSTKYRKNNQTNKQNDNNNSTNHNYKRRKAWERSSAQEISCCYKPKQILRRVNSMSQYCVLSLFKSSTKALFCTIYIYIYMYRCRNVWTSKAT